MTVADLVILHDGRVISPVCNEDQPDDESTASALVTTEIEETILHARTETKKQTHLVQNFQHGKRNGLENDHVL
jgi:hypothetical protein